MKQSSIGWLQECISIHLTHEQQMQLEGLFQQAKEMHKQDSVEAGCNGYDEDDIGTVSGSTDWKKPLIDRCKYELRRYTELAKRMDELLHERNLEADYVSAKEAEIKRNCYRRFVNDLKQLLN